MPAKSFQEYQREKYESEWNKKVERKKTSLNNQQRVDTATEYKRIGGEKFKSRNTLEAVEYYREAYFYVHDLVDARREERVKLGREISTIWSTREGRSGLGREISTIW